MISGSQSRSGQVGCVWLTPTSAESPEPNSCLPHPALPGPWELRHSTICGCCTCEGPEEGREAGRDSQHSEDSLSHSICSTSGSSFVPLERAHVCSSQRLHVGALVAQNGVYPMAGRGRVMVSPLVPDPAGTCGCIFIQPLLSPLAAACYGRRSHDNLYFQVQRYPRSTEKLAKVGVLGLFCIQKLWKHIKHKYEQSED